MIRTCRYHSVWRAMLNRCNNSKYHETSPTYKDCTVCDDWIYFSSFKSWMEKQDWEDKQLDKDILNQGNKIYSPENCVFVTQEVNNLLINRGRRRGKYMLGVGLFKPTGKFRVRCSDNGKLIHLGYFTDELKAHKAYCEFKYKVIAEVAERQVEKVKIALLKYKIPKY